VADDKSAAGVARDRAIGQAVDIIVYLGIMAAVSLAIAKRDTVTRLWMRVKKIGQPRDPYARQVAEFRPQIADISRGSDGPDTTRTLGLYER